MIFLSVVLVVPPWVPGVLGYLGLELCREVTAGEQDLGGTLPHNDKSMGSEAS